MSTQPPIAEINQSILPLDDLTALMNSKESSLEKLDVLYLHIERVVGETCNSIYN